MKKWLRITLVVLIAFALAGFTFVLNRAYISKHTDLKTVAIAKETVYPFNQLKEYQLTKVARSAVPEDAVTDLKNLNDKKWFAGKLGIGKGDIIRKSRIVDTKTNPFGQALGLKDNNVLIGVKTDLILSAGKSVRPGVLTNVLVFLPGNDRELPSRVAGPQWNNKPPFIYDPLLGNLLVREIQNADGTPLGEKGREALPVVAVIEASIPVAQQLVYYQEIGKVYLTPVGVDMEEALKIAAAASSKSTQTPSLTSLPAPSSQTKPNTTPEPNSNTRSR